MSGIRIALCKSIHAATDSCFRTGYTRFCTYGRILPGISFSCLPTTSGIHTSNIRKEVDSSKWVVRDRKVQMLHCLSSSMLYASRSLDNSPLIKMLHFRHHIFPMCTSMKHYDRSYSSHAGSNQDRLQNIVSAVPIGDASTNKATDSIGNEWGDILKDAVITAGKKVKDVSNEVVPSIQKLYDSHPYMEKILVPVCGTVSATILAWLVLPKILRMLHMYALRSPFSLLSRGSTKVQVPYEKSMWSALEDPARYLVTFMAFSQLGVIIVPSTLEYIPQVWRGAIVLSSVWFLHRWKTNIFSSAIANQITVGLDRENLVSLEKMSSVGLLVLGAMALAEACGVPVQSLLTIGGVGGVATAYASRDILGNLFNGLSLQFSKPFCVGDYIKAGSIEGKVVDMRLTTTSLLSPEKYCLIVPNSLFASQVIVNRTPAPWRSSVIKIPIQIHDLDKVPLVSEEIRYMLRTNPNVFLEKDAPYCFLSRMDSSFAEITLGYNLQNMRKDDGFAAEEEILLQATRIIKKYGVGVGSAYDSTSH